MKRLETYFELAKLKFQAFELCHEKEDTVEHSDKLSLFYRLNSIIEKSTLNSSTVLKTQIQNYINEYSKRELYKNEVFERELSSVIAIIDELKIVFYESEVATENSVFQQQFANLNYEVKSLEDRLKSSGYVLEAFFKSKLFLIQLGVLIAFLGFAFYGILQIKDFKVNVDEISKNKIEEARKQIEAETQKTKNDIDGLDKEYKAALFDLTKDNSSKYKAETEQFILSEKERIKSSVTDYISQIKGASKPEIDKAIGNIQIAIGGFNEKLKSNDEAIAKSEKTLQNLDNKIFSIKQNLLVIDTTLNKFKTSPTLNIVDKISTVLNLSKIFIWGCTGLLIVILFWLIVLSIKIRNLKAQRK